MPESSSHEGRNRLPLSSFPVLPAPTRLHALTRGRRPGTGFHSALTREAESHPPPSLPPRVPGGAGEGSASIPVPPRASPHSISPARGEGGTEAASRRRSPPAPGRPARACSPPAPSSPSGPSSARTPRYLLPQLVPGAGSGGRGRHSPLRPACVPAKLAPAPSSGPGCRRARRGLLPDL